MTVKILCLRKTDENGVVYEYLPCRRDSDGAYGLGCAKNVGFIEVTGCDFIWLRQEVKE